MFATNMRESAQEWMHHVRDQLPTWTRDTRLFGWFVWQWLGLILLMLLALVVGRILQLLIGLFVRRLVSRAQVEDAQSLLNHSPGPLRAVLAVILFHLGLPLLELPHSAYERLDLITRAVMIVIGGWVLIRIATLFGAVLEAILLRQTTNPAHHRSIRTQIKVPLNVFRFLIILFGLALVLIQFDLVRTVGLSMLASAGVVGVVIGLAAQRTVANVLAGIQLAIFQPIRIGDAVVVEQEYGWIEEIGLAYVVVRIWDDRRLVLPVSYFLEKPFHNWTRQSPEILGTVMLYVDYTVKLEEVREELTRLLRETPLWDGREHLVQVNDLTVDGVQLRILVSAADGVRLWDLRCQIREGLLGWLQTRGKGHLPVKRSETRAVSG